METHNTGTKESKWLQIKKKIMNKISLPKYNDHRTFYWGIGIVFLGGILSIFLFPLLFTSGSIVDYTKTGAIGDTINGISGPFIALGAAFLTFLAFYIQYIANKKQDKQFNDQNKQWTIERFESKFYSLIEIHRNNVSEIDIRGLRGRKAFIAMYKELKFIYLVVDDCYKNKWRKSRHGIDDYISPEIIYNISYLIFFFGIGKQSSSVVKDLIPNDVKIQEFFSVAEEVLQNYQNGWFNYKQAKKKDKANVAGNINVPPNPLILGTTEGAEELKISFKPFDGHTSILSHYIRNLFQLYKFIDKQTFDIDIAKNYETQYDYATTLRSQLTTHEQLLIYYNAFSVLGRPWFSNGLLKKYTVVKSMPLPLANFYKNNPIVDLEAEYAKDYSHSEIKEKPMFEWVEIQKRFEKLLTVDMA